MLKSCYLPQTLTYIHLLSRLSNITIQIAQPNDTGGPAAPIVEICNCPMGYRGTSCEECATGYKRVLNGTCIPCQCNGHSNLCHPETGLCQVFPYV